MRQSLWRLFGRPVFQSTGPTIGSIVQGGQHGDRQNQSGGIGAARVEMSGDWKFGDQFHKLVPDAVVHDDEHSLRGKREVISLNDRVIFTTPIDKRRRDPHEGRVRGGVKTVGRW